MNKRMPKVMVIACAVTVMLLLSFLYPGHRVLATEQSLVLPVHQEIRGNSPYPKPKEAVHYRLEAVDEAPLPEGTTGSYDFTIKGENTYQLHFQHLPKGTYHYKLYQLPQPSTSRLAEDSSTYTIQLEVFQSNDGMVIRPLMMDDQYHKLESLRFVNQLHWDKEEEHVRQTLGGQLPNTGVVDDINCWLIAIVEGLILLFLLKKKEENEEDGMREWDDSSH